jgi:hypothetical protein
VHDAQGAEPVTLLPTPDSAHFLISRLTDAAEIPANLAASRTPFPVINAFLAFSALCEGMGGLPNRTNVPHRRLTAQNPIAS